MFRRVQLFDSSVNLRFELYRLEAKSLELFNFSQDLKKNVMSLGLQESRTKCEIECKERMRSKEEKKPYCRPNKL